MRRRLLRYLARKYNYDLVPESNASPSLPLQNDDRLPAWVLHLRDLLVHPMSGVLPASRASIPAIGQQLYFRSSLCTAVDFHHPDFDRWRRLLGEEPRLHRKLWEHVFVAAHLEAAGALREGRRGLGFGVGTEPLPAAFAAGGTALVCTDLEVERAAAAGWAATGQHAASLDQLNRHGICVKDEFERLVRHETCDMNAISGHLRDFDFCWSSCSLEHLGSIQAGCDFVKNSLETLKPGGIAVHTTEFNISSNDLTIDNNPTLVIFRRKDIDRLVADLRSSGHAVADVCYDVLTEPIDLFVDVPPYKADAHIRLALGPYVCTSIGLVIQKAG
jgi:hypothetical protein